MLRQRIAAVGLLLLVAAPSFGQDPAGQGDVVLRGDLVELRAVVTDKEGRLRDDLTQKDFQVLDNGVPRDIAFFAVHRIPATAARTTVSPGTPHPAREPQPAPTAEPLTSLRSIVFFVDNANLASPDLVRARKEVGAFVDTKLADTDLAAVAASHGSAGSAGQFTHDRALLHTALDRLAPHPPPAGTGGFTPYLAAEIVRGTNEEALNAGAYLVRIEDKIPPPMDADVPGGDPLSNRLKNLARQRAHQVLAEAAERRRLTLLALNHAVDLLARAPGQRLLALVSDGFSMFDVGGEREVAELRAVVARAVRSGVVIYSIAGAGLEPTAYTGPDDPLYPIPPQVFPGLAQASRRDLEDGVTAIAKDTGGEVFRNTNDLEGALGRMLDENRVYYAIAYYADSADAGAHSIDVRLVSHPELAVRAQRGFDASAVRRTAQPVVDALSAPEPIRGLAVSASAGASSASGGKVDVSMEVHVDGERITYEASGETHAFSLEVATAFVDEHGASVEPKVETLDGRLKDRAYALALANGFRVERAASLAPGRYQLRVAVREPSSGRIGTASVWVDVPDIAGGSLGLGRIELVANELKRGDELVYAARVFNAPVATAEVRVAIVQEAAPGDPNGRVVYRTAFEPLSAHAPGATDRAALAKGRLGLGGAPPGTYRLIVDVRTVRDRKPTTQSVAFRIVP